MMAEKTKIIIDWTTIHMDCDAVADKLRGTAWTGIVSIARGGLAPAALIARALDIKLVETVCISSYNRLDQKRMEIIKSIDHIGDGAGWLVIDDLSDTGRTFATMQELLPAAHRACLYVKPMGQPFAQTWLRAYPQDCWLNFPWEMKGGFSEDAYELY